MKKYHIWVSLTGGYYTTIQAEDSTTAEEIAMQEFDPAEVLDWDVETITEYNPDL